MEFAQHAVHCCQWQMLQAFQILLNFLIPMNSNAVWLWNIKDALTMWWGVSWTIVSACMQHHIFWQSKWPSSQVVAVLTFLQLVRTTGFPMNSTPAHPRMHCFWRQLGPLHFGHNQSSTHDSTLKIIGHWVWLVLIPFIWRLNHLWRCLSQCLVQGGTEDRMSSIVAVRVRIPGWIERRSAKNGVLKVVKWKLWQIYTITTKS